MSLKEVKRTTSAKDLNSWVLFYKTNPPIRTHINLCCAQIAYTLAMSNADKNSRRKLNFDDFVLDYKKYNQTNDEKVALEIDKVFGGLAEHGRK